LKEILSKSAIFKDIEDTEIENICKFCSEQEFNDGDIIIQGAEEGTDIFIILEGRVGIERHDSDGDYITKIGKGEIFGEMSFIQNIRRSNTVAAACSPTKVLVIDGKELELFLNKNTSVGYQVMKNLLTILCHRLENVNFMLNVYKG